MAFGVDGSLDIEVTSEVEPIKDHVEESVDIGAAVVAGHLLMEMPPDTFDRVGFGGIGRKKMEADAVSPSVQVFADLAAAVGSVKQRVVANHMDDGVTPKCSPQLI